MLQLSERRPEHAGEHSESSEGGLDPDTPALASVLAFTYMRKHNTYRRNLNARAHKSAHILDHIPLGSLITATSRMSRRLRLLFAGERPQWRYAHEPT